MLLLLIFHKSLNCFNSSVFSMVMALYPQAQKKAQEELDRIIGNHLPKFNDRPNLPYINAMVKESLRWQLVTPLGIYQSFFRIALMI